MTELQENAMNPYVADIERMGGSVSLFKMKEAANAIHQNGKLKVSPQGHEQPVKKLGKHWAERFVKRTGALDVVIQKPLEVKRQKAHNPNKVRDYFDVLHRAIKDVHPKDIWNMDEIGFQIGMGGKRKIVTTDTSKIKSHYIASYSDRESLTIVEAVNAAGDVIPPMILFSGTIIHAQNARNGLPDATLIVPTENGFTTDLNGLRWLKHFDVRSKGFMYGTSRVLVMDGHGSHATYEFLEYARQNNIVLVNLPAHLTHLLQPLDLRVFNPYKHFHRRQVNEKADLGCEHYNIAEFLAGLPAVRKEAFKASTIQHAFREAGIVPYNPDIVLRKMQELHRATDVPSSATVSQERPSTPPPVAGPSRLPATVYVTPTKPKEFVKMHEDLKAMDKNSSDYPVVQDKFQRGSVTMALKAGRIEEEWTRWREYNQEKDKRQNHGLKHLASGIPVDVGTLRRIDARQMADEPLVVTRANWLKEREDIADARRQTGPFWTEMAKATTKRRAIRDITLKDKPADKGKGKEKETVQKK
jgi:hypothetical protein